MNPVTKNTPVPPATPEAGEGARTDDLLAGGAEIQDGARGFESKADPQALQTGMEGIAGASNTQGNRQSESHNTAPTKDTLPDNPVQ